MVKQQICRIKTDFLNEFTGFIDCEYTAEGMGMFFSQMSEILQRILTKGVNAWAVC